MCDPSLVSIGVALMFERSNETEMLSRLGEQTRKEFVQ